MIRVLRLALAAAVQDCFGLSPSLTGSDPNTNALDGRMHIPAASNGTC